MKIHYYSFSDETTHPVDKRRFYLWASSKYAKEHEILILSPGQVTAQGADISIVSGSFDLCKFTKRDWPTAGGNKVLQLVDGYGLYKEKWYRDVLRGMFKFLKREVSRPILSYDRLIRRAVKEADAIICASIEQSAIIQGLNERVVFVPDNHSFLRGKVSPSPCPLDSINLFWEGLPESLNSLISLRRQLELIDALKPVRLFIVTNSRGYKIGGKFLKYDVERRIRKSLSPFVTSIKFYSWSEENLLEAAASSSIALLPVNTKSDLHKLKHESRLLLYMQLGLPVVCANLPSYRRLAREANLEHLVFETPEQFTHNVLWLSSRKNWNTTVATVINFIQENHSLTVYESKWNQIMHFVVGKDSTTN